MTGPNALINAVRDKLPQLAPDASLDAEHGEVLVPVPEGRVRISLKSLEQAAAATPPAQWPDLVENWLQALKTDLEQVRSGSDVMLEQLRIQLKPHDKPPAEDLVLPYDDNFDVAVVVDHETRVAPLTYSQASKLGVAVDEISKRALQQTIKNELHSLDVRDHTLRNGVAVRVVAQDGNPYVSATLTSLGRFTSGDAPHGVIVAVPQYSAVMLHEVRTRDVIDFLVPFGRLAKSMHDDARDPFGTGIYWWVDGRYHHIEIEEVGADTARAHLPGALRPVVEALTAT